MLISPDFSKLSAIPPGIWAALGSVLTPSNPEVSNTAFGKVNIQIKEPHLNRNTFKQMYF